MPGEAQGQVRVQGAGVSRRRLMAANWKMHKLPSEAGPFVARLLELLEGQGLLAGPGAPEVVICPPFVALAAVGQALAAARQAPAPAEEARRRAGPADARQPAGPHRPGDAGRPADGQRRVDVYLGAQDVHWEPQGAFTGEVSAPMLADAGCRYVIVGHSERRQLFGETDEQVARKVRAALSAGLVPIVCVGETLHERRAAQTEAVVLRQLQAALGGLSPEEVAGLVVAYEPVWAIGTGENASGEEAARVIGQVIRAYVGRTHGEQAAASVRILYGGSVSPENIGEFMAYPDIDGALVGGASLAAERFAAIVAAGRKPA